MRAINIAFAFGVFVLMIGLIMFSVVLSTPGQQIPESFLSGLLIGLGVITLMASNE